MSTLHFPEGYQYKCYQVELIVRHQHVLEVISPHVATITLGILALALLQLHNRFLVYRVSYILAYASCLVSHSLSYPLLSLCLAAFYTTWVPLPGSSASLTLPSHAKFLATTNFTPAPHAEEKKMHGLLGERHILGPPSLQALSLFLLSYSHGLGIPNRLCFLHPLILLHP
jgi:hypothetical protein